MIVQGILDAVAQWLAGIVRLLPPLPGELAELLSQLQSGALSIGAGAAKMGVLVPYETAGSILTIWISLLAFWGIVLGIRFALWLFAR